MFDYIIILKVTNDMKNVIVANGYPCEIVNKDGLIYPNFIDSEYFGFRSVFIADDDMNITAENRDGSTYTKTAKKGEIVMIFEHRGQFKIITSNDDDFRTVVEEGKKIRLVKSCDDSTCDGACCA